MADGALWPDLPTRWRVSAAWLAKQHDCTPRGIADRCGGGCCTNVNYWPPSTGTGAGCPYLGGPDNPGCTLSAADRPVTCLLSPLLVNANGTIVLHARATTGHGVCKGNFGRGPMLIDALQGQLTALFGPDAVARVRADVVAGRDSYFDVPADVLAAYEREHRWALGNVLPVPRGGAA